MKTCKKCGALMSVFLEHYESGICDNCHAIMEMERNGALAKNGLMATDLM